MGRRRVANPLKVAIDYFYQQQESEDKLLMPYWGKREYRLCLELLIQLMDESGCYVPKAMRIKLNQSAAELGINQSLCDLIAPFNFSEEIDYLVLNFNYIDGQAFKCMMEAYNYLQKFGALELKGIPLEECNISYGTLQADKEVACVTILPKIPAGKCWLEVESGGPQMTLFISLLDYRLLDFHGGR